MTRPASSPVHVSRDCFVEINGVDLSFAVRRAALTSTFEELDRTGVGMADREFEAGISTGELTLEWYVGYGEEDVIRTLRPLVGTVVRVSTSPEAGRPRGANPRMTADFLIDQLPLLDGTHSEVSTATTTWRRSGPVTVLPHLLAQWSLTVGQAGNRRGFDEVQPGTYGSVDTGAMTFDVGSTAVRIRGLYHDQSQGLLAVYFADNAQAVAAEGLWIRMGPLPPLSLYPAPASDEWYRGSAPAAALLTAGDVVQVQVWTHDPR